MQVICVHCQKPVTLIGHGQPGPGSVVTAEPFHVICKPCITAQTEARIDSGRAIPRAEFEGKIYLDWLGAWVHSDAPEARHLYGKSS